MGCPTEVEKLGKDMKNIESNRKSHLVAKCIRAVFVLFGVVYVLYGFTKTMQKFSEGNVLVKEQVLSPTKYKYPSVTFCYKYKHGSKDVLHNYYPDLFRKWKQSGKLSCFLYGYHNNFNILVNINDQVYDSV